MTTDIDVVYTDIDVVYTDIDVVYTDIDVVALCTDLSYNLEIDEKLKKNGNLRIKRKTFK